MTEMVNGEGSNFQPSSNAGIPVTSSVAPQSNVEAERTFKQSEVNDLVGRAKSEAVERFKREASIASHNYQPQQQPQYGQSQHPQQPVQQAQPQYNGMSENEYRRMAAEEAQRLRNEWVQDAQRTAQEQDAQRIANEFLTKIGTGKTKYQDFDQKVQEVGFGNFPHIVQLANMMENTDDIVYELANNPTKIGAIQTLIDHAIRSGTQPTLALAEMRKLSNSIKENAKASNFKAPNDPLSQMRPSNAGTGKMGERTPGDYKRNPAYRV